VWISAYSSANGDELRYVESSFAQLEFRHERLTLSETFPELYLCNARIFAGLHQQFNHSLVEIGTN
jgi:hypothetical protein